MGRTSTTRPERLVLKAESEEVWTWPLSVREEFGEKILRLGGKKSAELGLFTRVGRFGGLTEASPSPVGDNAIWWPPVTVPTSPMSVGMVA